MQIIDVDRYAELGIDIPGEVETSLLNLPHLEREEVLQAFEAVGQILKEKNQKILISLVMRGEYNHIPAAIAIDTDGKVSKEFVGHPNDSAVVQFKEVLRKAITT